MGLVAQLVEQGTENPCVGGSIPSQTTNKKPLLVNKQGFFIAYLADSFYPLLATTLIYLSCISITPFL